MNIYVTSYIYIRKSHYNMNRQYLENLGQNGFTARIKRISELLIYDARKIYKSLNLEIEPNWHLVFLLLKREKQLTVTQIAQQLNFSHPAIIKIVKQMKKKGYLQSTTDSNDARRQLLQLTKKSEKELPVLEREWGKIHRLLQDVVDSDMLRKLSEIEKKLNYMGLYERYQDLKENGDT